MHAPSTYVPALWASVPCRQVAAADSVHLGVAAAGYVAEHICLHKVVLADFAGVSRQLVGYSYYIRMDSVPSFFPFSYYPCEVPFPHV